MKSAMLIAGAIAVLAGLGAVALGIPIKEFSTGNTMILSGTIGLCTGLILLGLSAVLGELKVIAHRLRLRPVEEPAPLSQLPELPGDGDRRDVPPLPDFTAAPPADEFRRDRDRDSGLTRRARSADTVAPPPEPEPPARQERESSRPKRNLLFESSTRRERERADKRDAPASEFRSPSLSEPPAVGPIEPQSFEENWPKPERMRTPEPPPLPRRSARAAPAFSEPEPPPSRGGDSPEVALVKSGVVDGMAYSLYSDGSIEAEMPEGMMRFDSIAELRTHLDQRG
jgi:hypothetical protein